MDSYNHYIKNLSKTEITVELPSGEPHHSFELFPTFRKIKLRVTGSAEHERGIPHLGEDLDNQWRKIISKNYYATDYNFSMVSYGTPKCISIDSDVEAQRIVYKLIVSNFQLLAYWDENSVAFLTTNHKLAEALKKFLCKATATRGKMNRVGDCLELSV